MAAFVTDNFTGTNGTNVTAHTPDVGGAWLQHPSYATGNVVIGSNNARSDTGGAATLVYNATDPTNANYSVTVTLILQNPGAFGFNYALCGRVDPSADTYYSVQLYDSYPFFQMVARVAGADSVIGTPVANSWNDGETHTLTLDMDGDQIVAKIDGVTIITATDNTITAKGKAGFRPTGGMGDFGSGDHGWFTDVFSADQAGGGAGVSTAIFLPMLGVG